MKSRFERDKQAEARGVLIAAEAEALKNWLEREHPDIRYGEAVLKAFTEDRVILFWSRHTLTLNIRCLPRETKFSRRRVPTEAEVKQNLIDEIVAALQATNDPHWTFAFNVRSELFCLSRRRP